MHPIEKFLIKVAQKIRRHIPRKSFSTREAGDGSGILNDSGRNILDAEQGNTCIRNLLLTEKPIMISRLGSTELLCIANYIQVREFMSSKGWKKYADAIRYDSAVYWREITKQSILNFSGFFPVTEAMLEKFSKDFLNHTLNIDVLGIWSPFFEDYVCQHYCKNATLVPLICLEPYFFKNPWSNALKEKKVLVIHPFEESIRRQFHKRNLLFSNPDILPDFKLSTMKSVQSIAGSKTNFQSWFEAYDSMCEKINKIEFDIALIGAGAYGLPLASFIKTIGKQAIHLGGATQILFGIKGKRWDDHEVISSLYNEHWVRPLDCEIPEKHKIVESGCYW